MTSPNAARTLQETFEPVRSPAEPRRSARFSQERVLRHALGMLEGPETLAVFDLDSTLLDNSPRQARIVREYGHSVGDERLAACRAEYWEDWGFEAPLARCGLSPDEVSRHLEPLKAYWRERFFTSEYCTDDLAHDGASAYLAQVSARGATICYVTGRHVGMGPGSVESFKRAGFPLPNGRTVHLMLKPEVALDDDAWKELVRERLLTLGRVACAFDNEPSHINGYRAGFSGCYAVHLDTDHSGRPVEVHPEIPSIRDFVL